MPTQTQIHTYIHTLATINYILNTKFSFCTIENIFQVQSKELKRRIIWSTFGGKKKGGDFSSYYPTNFSVIFRK